MLVSYDFNSLYPGAQVNINSTWPKIEAAYPFKRDMSESICSLFISGKWNELIRCAFLTVKSHNPENLVFEHLAVKEKIKNPHKNNR